MQRACTAERNQSEATWIDPASDRHKADALHHRCIHHAMDAESGLFDGQAERAGDMSLDRLSRAGWIEPHRPAGKTGRIEPAEHHRGVSDRGLLAALAVAGGTRIGAGGMRPDPEPAGAVEPGD